ncbi:MAG: hypothetical protein IT450_13645 [Phycisphaerales bacterium]|nr:hypothetical protein [Phycisphaerales bacterium]
MNVHRDTVPEIVRRAIAETCGCEIDAVRPEALFFDLLPGDDSLELIDLEFRLGKALRTPIQLGKQLTANLATDRSGALSPSYLHSLRERHPFLPYDRLPPHPKPSDLPWLLTVDAIMHLVAAQLGDL